MGPPPIEELSGTNACRDSPALQAGSVAKLAIVIHDRSISGGLGRRRHSCSSADTIAASVLPPVWWRRKGRHRLESANLANEPKSSTNRTSGARPAHHSKAAEHLFSGARARPSAAECLNLIRTADDPE